ncbi:VWA domain-containing protein [Shewanella eurypsychrophilus]|uniref:VWA domain-containing protein n=1 Tax=Shewanella eurypsychrophilus TaxID=2593656 RepID=A0ABX6V7L1_9GAMM|nr:MULTISPECIES: VWA domain-containing protein [Shewanella]QFU23274.1 VWA domain-containing protein [Shewanella sp. YLB-09]QPG58503.1 VWA domain-containing protein [Shewanella eurypsychrophilus]
MLLSQLEQFHFIRPSWLLLLLPIGVLFAIQWRRGNTPAQWQNKLPTHLLNALSVGDNGWKKMLPLKIWCLALSLATLIAAGPTWQRQASPFGEDKAPLIIVLDVSSSMLEKDVQPSRLVRAKQKIEDLIQLREGGPTALIVYSGSAHLAMPLTRDSSVFSPLLHAVSSDIMPREGKFAQYALPVIERLISTDSDLEGMPIKAIPIKTMNLKGSSTVLLITDGLGGGTATAFKQYFNSDANSDANSKQNTSPPKLIVFGVGDTKASAQIPFDPKALKQLALDVSGEYIPLTVSSDDIESIIGEVQSHFLMSHDSAEPWRDMGYGLVFVVAAIFLLWFRRGWTVQWCLVGALLLASSNDVLAANTVTSNNIAQQSQQAIEQAQGWHFLDIWLTRDQQASYYFQQGEYLQAAAYFESPMWKATAFYLAEDFKSAHSYFMRVDSDEARLGAANALVHQREYIAGRNFYREITIDSPDFTSAQTNLAKVQKIIDDNNRQSESQANTEDEPSQELGDEPQTGDGAEEKVAKEFVQKTPLTAQELLEDDTLNQVWMKRVQGDPKRFLSSKFRIQLEQVREK